MKQSTICLAGFSALLFGCPGPAPSNGPSGSDAGPMVTLSGSDGFVAVSAIPLWNVDTPLPSPDAGLDQREVTIRITTLSRDLQCAEAAAEVENAGQAYPQQPQSEAYVYVAADAGELVAGEYADVPAGLPLESTVGSLLQRIDIGSPSDFIGFGGDGGVTLTKVVWPTYLGGTWYSGGEIDGTFSFTVAQYDGGVGSFSGTFQAVGCDYEPLDLWF